MTAINFVISLIGIVSDCISQFVTYIFQVPALLYSTCILVGCGFFAVVYRIFKGVIM